MMDNLMDASTFIDYERHVKDFTDRLKSIVTKEHLIKVCEEYQKDWCRGYYDGIEVTLAAIEGRTPECIVVTA